MDIPAYQLFLGFPVENQILSALESLSLSVRTLFIQNSPDYLHEIYYEGRIYLGKPLKPMVDTEELEELEANIYSLLNKLLPNQPIKSNPLILFAHKNVH
jgi:hypothetical protein